MTPIFILNLTVGQNTEWELVLQLGKSKSPFLKIIPASNSWTIPLNPVKSDSPLDTSEHLLKGAMAVASKRSSNLSMRFNNRGVNAFEGGELDDWGGHFGRGDDYHYHLVPTHLEETVGKETSPLAYALDGYPVYGYTDEALDDCIWTY